MELAMIADGLFELLVALCGGFLAYGGWLCLVQGTGIGRNAKSAGPRGLQPNDGLFAGAGRNSVLG